MKKWTKFNKVMSWFVMLSGIAGTLYLSISLFSTAGSYGALSSSYYSSAASSALATVVWLGILTLVTGCSASIGIFAAWNMLINWYDPDSASKAQPYIQPTYQQTPMYYAPPAQPANWQCPACGGINEATNGFCYNCGKPKQ